MRLTLAAAAISLAFSAPALADNATIDQNGIDNYASIDQGNADGSAASIQQIGNRNQAGSAQSGEDAATLGIRQLNAINAQAVILQRGDDNRARVDQAGVTSVTALVTQGDNVLSHRNFGQIVQQALSNSLGEVYQDHGNDNVGIASQTGSSNWGQVVQGSYRADGAGGWIFTGAAANANFGAVDQSGTHQTSRINQLGTSNTANSIQGGAWNDALIIQDGAANHATVHQLGTGAALADSNSARITQTGVAHAATATQSGMGNTALINQH